MNFSKLKALIIILIGLIFGTIVFYFVETGNEYIEYIEYFNEIVYSLFITIELFTLVIIIWSKISDKIKKRQSSKDKIKNDSKKGSL